MMGQQVQRSGVLTDPLVVKAANTARVDFQAVVRKTPKGSEQTPLPYFDHLQRVASTLAEFGYPAPVVAAGYLHDHLEDLPEVLPLYKMRAEFGPLVASLVDWVTHRDGTKSWEEKTQNYFRHLQDAPDFAVAISAADKLVNMQDLLAVLKAGYPVSSVMKRGWQPNSYKFHQLLEVFSGKVHPKLLDRYRSTLDQFDRLGPVLEAGTSPQLSPDHRPKVIQVPQSVRKEIAGLADSLAELYPTLSEEKTQLELRHRLMSLPAYGNWILPHLHAAEARPVLVEKGLGFERDDDFSRVMLVGLAVTLQPGHICPPYSIGGQAVTEVIAQANSTVLSHSQNDLPAPSHTAGFFEETPPHTCYFCCIRPHAAGGGATTVLDVNRVLEQAPQALIDEWTNKPYLLRTSARLGGEIVPFQMLRWIGGVPFLRYRKECMVGFDQDPSLRLLEELVQNPANHFIVPLKAGETLVHWNGLPHSRLAQNGPTPSEVTQRRKLIRCRTIPQQLWSEDFKKESRHGA
jgi:hypothetical protein